MRLKDKIAIVVGAGQSPGEGLGNGRATVLRFAQEGACWRSTTISPPSVARAGATLAKTNAGTAM
jgi:NAD(P)-dependent dehydrogenase (short-subunit alcohol dehydrogenase family)